jgi:hypothetical protein
MRRNPDAYDRLERKRRREEKHHDKHAKREARRTEGTTLARPGADRRGRGVPKEEGPPGRAFPCIRGLA